MMTNITKGYKFRIYPTKEQEELLLNTFGCCRFVYNYMLNYKNETYKESKTSLSRYDLSNLLPNLKSQNEWLTVVDSRALQEEIKILDKSLKKFFDGKGKVGFPKFKSKKNDKQSYTTSFCNNNIEILSDEKHIKLPKLGKMKCKLSKEVIGKIVSATITKNPSGKYFVSICCTNIPYEQPEKTGCIIGLDLGIKDFIICSDGVKFPNNHFLKKSEKKLCKEQTKLSRKSIGSDNRNKQRIKVAKLYEKITNQRKDYMNKISTQLVRDNDIICIEDLNVRGMIKNHKLSKSICDCSWSTFVNMLTYKCIWNDKQLVKIDRFFSSSKICSECGYKLESLTLNVREWVCPECGKQHDRDINAGKNILNEGLRILHT